MPGLLPPKTVHIWQIFIPDFSEPVSVLMRKILSYYSDIPPEKLEFIYGPKGKPALLQNPKKLEFNLSHSKDWAVLGITQGIPLGVDIEKKETTYNKAVAKRFFKNEVQDAETFYQLWVNREAAIKALGGGVFSNMDLTKVILYPFQIDPHYSSAFAVLSPIDSAFSFKMGESCSAVRGVKI